MSHNSLKMDLENKLSILKKLEDYNKIEEEKKELLLVRRDTKVLGRTASFINVKTVSKSKLNVYKILMKQRRKSSKIVLMY